MDLAHAQLQRLRPILDASHRSQTKLTLGFGIFLAVLAVSCPASKVLGAALEGAVRSPFVHRLANIPIWVVAIMVVCAGFLAAVAFFLTVKQRRMGSPVVAHLTAHGDDPLRSVHTRVVVNRGYRSAHYHFRTASGRELTEVLGQGFETRMEDALANLQIERN